MLADELHVFILDSYPAGMVGQVQGILHDFDKVGFRSFLQGSECRPGIPEVVGKLPEIEGDFADLEWLLATE
jgi:hypothetical protein